MHVQISPTFAGTVLLRTAPVGFGEDLLLNRAAHSRHWREVAVGLPASLFAVSVGVADGRIVVCGIKR